MINLIWAQSKNGVIAKDNQIPWSLKSDLENFKLLTTDQVVLMGASTYDSLPIKPLPDRINLVLSHRDQSDFIEGVRKVESIDQAIQIAKHFQKDLYVIGGKSLYQKTIADADYLYVTIVDVEIDDGLELEINLDQFNLIENKNYSVDKDNQYNFSINKYSK